MSLDAVKIRGINITKSSKKEVLEFLQKSLDVGSKKQGKTAQKFPKIITIATPNPEQIVYANSHPYFADILNRADVAIPDGVGVVWASRFLSPLSSAGNDFRLSSAIPGIDFMENLVSEASKLHV